MLQQILIPGREIFYAGDSITVEVVNIPVLPGKVVFRSNLPGIRQRRQELIAHHEKGADLQALDWHDIEIPGSGRKRSITLPLTEIGIFEGKCCFIPAGGAPLQWAEGGNFKFKVISASAIAGNTFYAAFVRQYGRNLFKPFSSPEEAEIRNLEQHGYSVIPSSGTFRQLKKQLDHIFGTLKCRILQLLPIHPVPAEYGRMGRFGSPFAALDYFAVEPSLGEFDPHTTPMEQFEELLHAVHARQGKLFLDIPVNHTGWASKLQQAHPAYFVRDGAGRFESPGAWGIVWEDLCKLDYSRKEVPELMAEVFLFWCAKGVDGFRCDAGYMVPEKAWDYIVAKVRSVYPETTFLLEGLGGPYDIQARLLSRSGLDCAYSEMFQNYSRSGIEYCLDTMQQSAARWGNLVSFAETHDNDRLAGKGKSFARLRFLVCGLLSTGGAFGFANGAEFYASEKIDVHKDSALNYGAEENLCSLISRINTLLSLHPAFTGNSRLQNITLNTGEAMAVLRSSAESGSRVLILLNLDCQNSNTVLFPGNIPDSGPDLLSSRKIYFSRDKGDFFFELAPGEALAVELDKTALRDPVTEQRIKVMEKRAFTAFHGFTCEKLPTVSFTESPQQFAEELSGVFPPPLTYWTPSGDAKRILPLPSGDLLLVTAPVPFRSHLEESGSGFMDSVPMKDGSYGVLYAPPKNTAQQKRHLKLSVELFENGRCRRIDGLVCQLPESLRLNCKKEYTASEVIREELQTFGANAIGSYALFPASWEKFTGKYEAFLAVNGASDVPVDRLCLFTGLDIYLVSEGYSRKVDSRCLIRHTASTDNCGSWSFKVPAGQGRSMIFEVKFRFPFSGNAVEFEFSRPRGSGVPDSTPVAVILRPELEYRINHHVTKAASGPEWEFPAAVRDGRNKFTFAPGEHPLTIEVSGGTWHREDEWHYMCDLPAERYYGLEDKTDRYSPGYFHISLAENSSCRLTAFVTSPADCRWNEAVPGKDPLISAMRRFVVKRGDLSTVIAGYPWFLDWGRDTLIALRGMLKAPEFQEACKNIIRAFAAFENCGTIPNVLCGSNDSNRDTSDAPLYLIIGIRDYIAETGDRNILDTDCGGRPLKAVVESIISHYISGTPNGIKADKESGLIFSPAHFSWMDTNFPAGTPREGYPVEIQALWYAALKFAGRDALAERVRSAILKYFFPSGFEGASDCLHCAPGVPAARAEADDHIRSNALLLITLGAVTDPALCMKILQSTSKLLIPGAIRSLADQPVTYPLPVSYNGALLNDPSAPYCGTYRGPENESRKKAYHNGTAWCWPFPGYCEALFCCGGNEQRQRALSLLSSGTEYFEKGVFGQLSEVADGDAPHRPGGCPAQAWSVTELFRVREILQKC